MTLAPSLPAIPSSLVSRLDPRWRLVGLLVAAVVATLLRSVAASLLCFVVVLLLVILARLPWRWYLGRLGLLALALALFVLPLPFLVPPTGPGWHLGFLVVSGEGLTLALILTIRAAALVSLGLLVLATGPIDATLKGCRALGLPAVLVHIGLLTYRYLFLLLEELARLRIALRVRGFRNRANLHSYRLIGNLTGMLLVRAGERAERVGQAMRCRGFDGRFRSLAEFQTRPADVLFVLGMVMVQAVVLWIDSGST